MAYPITATTVKEAGNGSKTAFSFAFTVLATTELNVYKGTIATDEPGEKLLLGVDYTVVLNAAGGGVVTFAVAPTNAQFSLIESAVPNDSTIVMVTRGRFQDQAILNAFTRVSIQQQQQAEKIDRCVKVPVGSSTSAADLISGLQDDISEANCSLNKAAAEAAQAAAEASAASAASSASDAQTAENAAEAAQAAAEAAAASVPTMATILSTMMPVGFVVTLGVSTNPATLYGFGTWSAIEGKVIVGIDGTQTEFDTLNETGGAKSVTLTAAQSGLPDHRHSITTDTDSSTSGGTNVESGPKTSSTAYTGYSGAQDASQAHTNLQPYIVKYVWERTA